MELPVMSYSVCLQCGIKRLTYGNTLCRNCLLIMKIQAVVEYHKCITENKAVNPCFGCFDSCEVTNECPCALRCRRRSKLAWKEKIIARRGLRHK